MNICNTCKIQYSTSNKNQKFCSRKCINESYKNGSYVHCKLCEKIFYRIRRRENTQKYCSKECFLKEFHARPKRKTGKHLNCMQCKKKFYARLYRIKEGSAKFCSRRCRGKFQFDPSIGFKKTGQPKTKYKTIIVNGKRILEHRWLMEQKLGRTLSSQEHVHHINGNGLDNRIDNLIVLSNADHQRENIKLRKKCHILDG